MAAPARRQESQLASPAAARAQPLRSRPTLYADHLPDQTIPARTKIYPVLLLKALGRAAAVVTTVTAIAAMLMSMPQ